MSTILKDIPDYTNTTLPIESGDSDDPSYKVAAYSRMSKFWSLVEDVYTGTFRIREKRETYLPKFPLESAESYTSRSSVAVLMNIYARTVDAMVGLVVGSGLKTKHVPDVIEKHIKNVDNAGTEFGVFARDVLRDAFTGHCVVLIDMPSLPEGQRPRNKTEQRQMNLRPYWTRHRPEDIYNWRTEVIDGETVVTQITFRECVTVPEGAFGERDEVRYLRWYLTKDEAGQRKAAFKKYVEEEHTIVEHGKKVTTTVYRVIDSNTTHLERIPMFIVYGDQMNGRILESKPPLLDLAHKNVEHLQIDSDYKKGLSIAGLAIPVLTSDKSKDDIEQIFGWDVIMCLGEKESFEFKEANGAALPNKRQALEDIKREMGVLGLSLIAERADANITATERLLDSVQQSNQLMAIQASLLQGLRKGLEIHAAWLRISLPDSESPEVALGLDWTELVRSADHMRMLFDMAKEDFLSTLTLIESAAKYGVLPSYINADEEIAKLKEEGRVRKSRFMMKSTTTGLGVEDTGVSKNKQKQESDGGFAESGSSADSSLNISSGD